MRALKALSFVFGFVTIVGCQGPDEFYRLSNDGDKTGAAGSSSPGTAGSTTPGTAGTSAAGVAGTTGRGGATTGSAGSILTGTGGSSGGGTAGSTGAGGGGGSGYAGSIGFGGSTGTAGTTASRGGAIGTAGSSAGGNGTAGTAGSTATGNAGAGGNASSRGGTTGSGGAAGGTSSSGGTAGGSAGSGGSGTTTGAGGAGGRGPDRIQVVAKCQGSNDAQNTRVTFKILNPESTAKAWSDIKIRYYFTPNTSLVPMVNFDFLQKFAQNQLTATATASYVEIGFTASAGMVMGFDNVTGSDQIQLRLYNFTTTSWNTTWTDDYSYKGCTGVANTDAYADRLTMPGYYQGQLAWGSEPDAP